MSMQASQAAEQTGNVGRAHARSRSRRALIVSLAMIGTAIGLWIGASLFITYQISHPPFLGSADGNVFIASAVARETHAEIASDPRAECGADYQNVSIEYGKGRFAAGWLVPAQRASAIVLLPAAGASRRAMLAYLKFLHGADFSVLMLDSPDYHSGAVKWGWDGRELAASAAAFLKRKGYRRVAALGVSEGAAALLMAQADAPRFTAIISDSSFADLPSMLKRSPSIGGLHPAFLNMVMWELGIVIGRDPGEISPVSAVRRLGRCSLMVIQNRSDPIVAQASGRSIYDQAAASDRELWLAPSNGHGDAIYEAPEQYAKRVLDFLGVSLSGARRHPASMTASAAPITGYILGGIRSCPSVALNTSASLFTSHGPLL